MAPQADPAAPAPSNRRSLLIAAIALPLVAWTALYAGAATPLKGILQRRATAAFGRPVTIGGPVRILVTPSAIRLSADQLAIANPHWTQDTSFLRAARVEARLDLFDLMIGRPALRTLGVQGGTLDLERAADGQRVNWTLGKAGTLFDLTGVRQLAADGIIVHYRDAAARSQARFALTDGGRGTIALSGGGRISDHPFTADGVLESAEGAPTRIDLRARSGEIALAIEGAADGPLRLRDARLKARVRGADFAQLAALGGVALPAMPDYAIAARIGAARGGWHFSHIEGRVGHTDLAGKLTLDQRRARPLVVATLASRNLDLADAKKLFGLRDGQDEALGTLVPRLLPDAVLSPEALRRFDAVVDYRAAAIIGTKHAPAHLAMTFALVGGLLQVSPASVDLAGGFVSTDLFIDARRSPVLTRADIRLSPTPMGRLLRDWGIAPAGTTAMVKGRIQLTGRGDTLREAIGNADGRMALIIPGGAARIEQASASSLDMATVSDAIFRPSANDGEPTDINCGLIAFTVRKGLATADPILIDTDGHVLTGRGEVDLRDERLDVRLTADGKAMALFARPSPVRIGGTLTDPVLEREPISWFSPSGFFGLPLPNLGAILGFVDPDDAAAPACGPILRGAPAPAMRKRR